ncbi:hypothetical protein TRIUR3_24924 [Triticum urartu]|uniref:Uncharacterized protein n=1 Tax=Triticum urartu TaxID=4572 RepID=M8ALL0_TRIUA|nr:hypothetical protein TRIUR3_24924 [Triticum urartu]
MTVASSCALALHLVEENSAYSWMAHPPATESHLPPPAGHPRVVCGSRPSFGSSEHLRGAPAMQATYLSPISATRSHRLRTASSWILLISLSPTHMRGTDIVSYDSFRHPVVLLPSAAPCGIWFKLQDFAIHGVDAAASCSGAAAAARLPPQAPRFLIKIFDFPSLSSTTHAPPEEEGTEVGAPANLHSLQRPTPSPAPCNWSCQYAASAAGECPPQGLRLAPLLRRSSAVPGPLPGRQGRAAPRLLQPGVAARRAGSGPLLRPIPVLLACSAELCRPRLAVNKLQAGWDKGVPM